MLPPDTFSDRRAALCRALPDGLVVLLGNEPVPMNYAGNPYPFRQDGSFRYYAGLDVPGLALALDTATGQATLYGQDATLEDRVWNGDTDSLADLAARAGTETTAAPDALDDAVASASAARGGASCSTAARGASSSSSAATSRAACSTPSSSRTSTATTCSGSRGS